MSTQVKTTTGGTQEYLQQLARDVVSQISGLDPSRSKELLGVFVSEMFRSVAEQERRETNRQRQAEGIASRPLPDNFHEVLQDWREGKLILQEAADAYGLPPSTFRDKVAAYERVNGN